MVDTKCKYALRCYGYRDSSYTCTKARDKRFCGIYRQLRNGACTISYICNKCSFQLVSVAKNLALLRNQYKDST